MHLPTGGVGLNVGIQDAMNLGWKLAVSCKAGRPRHCWTPTTSSVTRRDPTF
ncbi:FAD-dependent monooxygenase [Streptomyces sp. NBC_01744]|nr:MULTISPECIES: FAD-dependent monooxygenase [unclassified Streptomyces]WSC58023.1 FAD-dependent monooxygenase [Streptomyces sp. NBC_01761]WSF89123.1 FAD-dependent monooxygenase [Streptomyces sp. NBC_01744]WSJ55331.1 FAD-dependent monooxygenase [Streptomyces sp. NBC_01318]